MATKNFMSMSTVVAIGKVLEEHMTRVDGGFGVYKEGFNDARIAAMATTAAAPINVTNVGNLRREMFGNFPPASRPAVVIDTNKLADLEAKLDGLDTCTANLVASINSRLSALEGRIASIELRLRPKDPLGDKNFPTGQGNPAKVHSTR